MEIARKIYDWASRKAYSPRAPLWLAFIFVLEMFVFLPMDALLILFCMHNPERRRTYAFVSTATSLVIGLIGYGVGYWLWDCIGGFVTQYLVSPAFFDRLVAHYTEYEYLAVFLGSLLPIPFKAITISGGFCKLPLLGFVVGMTLARALRFFFLAEMMLYWNAAVRKFIDRHFSTLVSAFILKTVLTVAFFWVLGK
ncbi:MAG: hypothetical protein RLZZ453_322 [Chlamydiota bacterium]|jgi:membrane protein YqaA with SNARE-associated domain